jgi:hypothetical protein
MGKGHFKPIGRLRVTISWTSAAVVIVLWLGPWMLIWWPLKPISLVGTLSN